MTRAELIRHFVLNSFCDADKDILQITKATDEHGPACGLTITRDDIFQALRELVEVGYARAWDAEPRKPDPPAVYPGMPSPEEITPDTVFTGTPEGLDFYNSLSLQPPMYWNGKLRKDWELPTEPFPRPELISLLVLAAMWNGYTTVDFLQMRMDDLALRLKTTFSRDEIMHALDWLIEAGYAKAARLDRGDPPCEYAGMPPLEDIVPYRVYFSRTPAGIAYHRSEPWWPFEDSDDAELKLRENWVPPVS